MANYTGLTVTIDDQGSPSTGYVGVTRITAGTVFPEEAPGDGQIFQTDSSPATTIEFIRLEVDPNNYIVSGVTADGTKYIFEAASDLTVALTT